MNGDPPPVPVAQVRGLAHQYGKVVALRGFDLTIPGGTLAGLVGPDGVGKSTLLSLLAGVRKIQRGAVEVLGRDMAGAAQRSEICARIAYMPQGLGRNLYPTLSVFENVDFFGRLFGYPRAEREARIRELLAATGLQAAADRPAGQLSGGMRQKLGLCCALVHDPDFLILDEPTTGVDPLSRRLFWDFIARLRARRPGLSLLVSTAYMDEAADFDWLIAMDDGAPLAAGRPGELLERVGATTLEEAFIALLPEEKRRDHRAIVLPPRSIDDTVSPPAIEAEGLTRRFGRFTAVDHVSFSVQRGEIFGFLGSNGCGKTTTMKMLTGLLPASEGSARLFGEPLDAGDLETRKRIGYMSQSFSLYTELTVRQNLELHAGLFGLPSAEIGARVEEVSRQFGLEAYSGERAEQLPLGIRQRLSLAVAVIHRPEVLILDEPTSGVDPVGRDVFWEMLIRLSREEGVTIFISTHFMNEAERCDRVALMHAGRLLACDAPAALVRARGQPSLEAAFIACLREADAASMEGPAPDLVPATEAAPVLATRFSPRRVLAFLIRESREILRDPIRLTFALLGPVLLMLVFGYGISFDVENLSFAVLDRDQTAASRAYLEHYAGTKYFRERPPLSDQGELERRMRDGELRLAIEVPPDFGRDLKRGRSPEIAVWLDGAMPFRGETVRGYVRAIHQIALADPEFRNRYGSPAELPISLDLRFRYNQAFKSIYAMVPSVLAVLLIFIPSVSTAVGVVREKELGSIINLYATPTTRLEFLIGKQAPYVAIAMLNFFTLVAMAVWLFGVPLKAGFFPLTLGAFLYVMCTTGIGLLISIFARTQIAALFAAGIVTVMPVVQFCGMMAPVSSLTGGAALIGWMYPTTYFMKVSVGAFTKALDFPGLAGNLLILAAFIPLLGAAGVLLLKKQEV